MLLTYWRVHLIFTIPIATVLSLILRPLLSKRNIAAIAFHVVVATAYTFPWDSYIIHNHAWWYPEWAVTYAISKVPVEEIFFFIIQSIFTAELFILLGLLDTPSQHLSYCGPDAPVHRRVARYGPLAVFPAVGYTAWHYMAIPQTKGFYLGCILWWISPVLTFLWWLAGDHFLSRRKTALLTILLPTFYLSIVDIVALRAGTWHINEATSTEIFVWPDLPLEEFTFFLLTSTILTVGMLAFDRCLAVVDVYGDVLVSPKQAGEAIVPWFIKPPRMLKTSWSRSSSSTKLESTTANIAGNDLTILIRKFGNSMLLNVDYLSASLRSRIPAFEITQAVLAKHSRSFHTASYVFPSAVRRDLVILYAFCRVMDDFCDESATKEEAKELIQMSRDFLDLVYPGTTHSSRGNNPSASSSPSLEKADKKSLLPSRPSSPASALLNEKEPEPQPSPSDFAISSFLHNRVPKDAQSSFFLLSTITSRVPRYPFDDLIEGYEWDLAGRHERPIVSEADLIEYSRLVAASVAEMCVWAMWANEGSCPSDPETRKHILQKAASMGIALQITNISRDIKEDAGKGRIYLPQDWFSSTSDEKKHFRSLEEAANAQCPPAVAEFPYAVYIRRLLDLAEVHKIGTNEAIRQLPRSCQAGIRAATRVYIGIGAEISKYAFDAQGNPNLNFDGRRISLTKWQRIRIALKAVYASI